MTINNTEALIKYHAAVTDECRRVMKAKNHDYSGASESPFSNFEACELFGVDPVIGILMRSIDKFKRIETFVAKGELLVEGEGIYDAFDDVINYMVLGRGMISNRLEENQYGGEAPTIIEPPLKPSSSVGVVG